MSDERLKPCPFCGGEAVVDHTYTGTCVVYGIHCYNCKVGYADYPFLTEEEAIAAWNTRDIIKRIIKRLSNELNLANEDVKRCIDENPLQVDKAKGYAMAMVNAIKIVYRGGADE